MSKLGLFLFVFALFVCCISAYPANSEDGGIMRVVRAASALPDPGRGNHYRGHSGYHHHHHYPPSHYHHGYGGYGYGGNGGYRGHGGYKRH